MKRRQFIKGVGMSSAALAATHALGTDQLQNPDGLPPYNYGVIESLDDVISQEGLVVVRLAVENNPDTEGHLLSGRIKVKKAGITRSRSAIKRWWYSG